MFHNPFERRPREPSGKVAKKWEILRPERARKDRDTHAEHGFLRQTNILIINTGDIHVVGNLEDDRSEDAEDRDVS